MKNKYNYITTVVISILILILQIVFLMISVHSMHGIGRVVNYAGIVRGATQRIIKDEICNKKADSEIERMDDILLGLSEGKGNQNLNVLDDKDYLYNLNKLIDEWQDVKKGIYEYRKDKTTLLNLYNLSEHYFYSANVTVDSAEKYSDKITKKLHVLEVTISINIALIIVLLIIEIFIIVKRNNIIDNIAHIDMQTGLPNKLSCDEKLKEAENKSDLCIVMFDLNNLKKTNDTYGHAIGDSLIIGFANLLKNIAGDMFVGRLGGDEFIGIKENADKLDIEKRLQDLKDNAQNTFISRKGNNIKISFALGYVFSEDYENISISKLLAIADKKMYENKSEMKKLKI